MIPKSGYRFSDKIMLKQEANKKPAPGSDTIKTDKALEPRSI
jgi:DNA-binding winged helix-turn-helix (wHTH) protein